MSRWFAHTYQNKVTFDCSALTQHFTLSKNRDVYSIATLTLSAHKKNISEMSIFNTVSSSTPALYPCFIKESKEDCKTRDFFVTETQSKKKYCPTDRDIIFVCNFMGLSSFNFFMLWQ